MTDKAQAEFDALIGELADARDEETQGRIRKSIWDRFGTSGTVFISDMANFSRTSRSHGICHFLKLIHRAKAVVTPIVADNKGTLLKCEADNCYAFFENAGDALQASFDINAELFRGNQELELDERTIVFFTGDNGGQDRFRSPQYPRGYFGPNVDPRTGTEFRGGKGNLYEGGLRIPFIVRWPSHIKPGQVSDLLFYQPDMLATIAARAVAVLAVALHYTSFPALTLLAVISAAAIAHKPHVPWLCFLAASSFIFLEQDTGAILPHMFTFVALSTCQPGPTKPAGSSRGAPPPALATGRP